MSDLFRETPLGQVIRWVTRNKVLLYPEERPGFQCPSCYSHADAPRAEPDPQSSTPASQESDGLEKAVTKDLTLQRTNTRTELEKITTRADLERAYTEATLELDPNLPVIPETLDDGTILVTWYDTSDPANPQNWSSSKKAFVAFQIW